MPSHLSLLGVSGPPPAAGGGPSTLPDNLVSYWKKEEATGANRADSVGTNTLIPAGTPSVTQVAGIIGNGAGFTAGDGNHLSVADNASLDLTTTGTWQAWIYWPGSPSGSSTLFCKGLFGSDAGWTIQTTSAGTELQMFVSGTPTDGGANSVSTTNAGFLTATWYHIVVVYDGGLTGNTERVKIYVNAVLKTETSSGTIPASLLNNARSFYVGARDGTSNRWNGRVDEAALWSRALTGAEVTELYNSGAGNQWPF